MARRCPRSKPLGLARLERHRLAVMREGWLTAVRAPRARRCTASCGTSRSPTSRALDRYEGAPRASTPSRPAGLAAGGAKRALVYFGANAGPGVAEAGLYRRVLAAARAAGLPAGGRTTWRGSSSPRAPPPCPRRRSRRSKGWPAGAARHGRSLNVKSTAAAFVKSEGRLRSRLTRRHAALASGVNLFNVYGLAVGGSASGLNARGGLGRRGTNAGEPKLRVARPRRGLGSSRVRDASQDAHDARAEPRRRCAARPG